MTPDQYERFHNLAKRHNIHFDGPVEPRKWPASHAQIFVDVQKLGKSLLDEYSESSVIDSLSRPWKAHTRHRAARLYSLANRCLRENRNEAGWRMLLEPEVMARFTVEVACPRCRKRLWRSEVEVTLDNGDAALESLEGRRLSRVPCTCPTLMRGEDYLEGGLNPLFSDRAQEVILHDSRLQGALPKREKPDRVYGLQATRRIQELLERISDRTEVQMPDDREIRDLKTSPFRQDGDPLLLPFLVLEAKSEKGPDNFRAIQMQTAFSIHTLLKMQVDLQRATREQPAPLRGPLVWFVASKGEQWRVSAGYTVDVAQATHYHIVELWSGMITSRDGSLRLLLIVDFIFDWARDMYRPTILQNLKTLAPKDTASLAGDSDIHSMADPVQAWLDRQELETECVRETMNDQDNAVPPSLLALDSQYGVIRHASFIQSHLQGLYITRDNVESLLMSFQTQSVTRRFARELLGKIPASWRTSAATLDALEVHWTGYRRTCEESLQPQEMFYVTFTLSAYLSPRWDQIREICYLAISEGAVDLLHRHAKNGIARPVPEQRPILGWSALERFCDRVRTASLANNLEAAMSSTLLEATVIDEPKGWQWQIDTNMGQTMGFTFSKCSSGPVRHLFSTVYFAIKIGRREPAKPFLRTSKRHERQSQEATPSFTWPLPKSELTCGEGVLLMSVFPPQQVEAPRWCFYAVSGPSKTLDICSATSLLQKAFNENSAYRLAYQESVKHRSPYNTAAEKSNDIWYDRPTFDNWLNHLNDIAKSRSTVEPACHVQSTSQPSALHADTTGSRKRRSEDSDEVDDAETQVPKRQGPIFDSDYLTDDAFQLLLDDQHFKDRLNFNVPEVVG